MLARVVAAAWGAAIVGTLVAASASDGFARAVVEHGPACPLLATTGVECPFCGMTRSSVALGRGDLHASLAHHPLGPLVLAAMLAILVTIALGRTDALVRGRRPQLLLAVLAVVWIVRLLV